MINQFFSLIKTVFFACLILGVIWGFFVLSFGMTIKKITKDNKLYAIRYLPFRGYRLLEFYGTEPKTILKAKTKKEIMAHLVAIKV